MGNEASKQEVVEPPPEWDPSSNAKKFELVSPMSDLSDPSMFLHRRPHPTLSNATVQQIALQKQTRPALELTARLAMDVEAARKGGAAAAVAARQTPAGDRRRKSKVIATRDSAYKHEPRPRELPPPSSFYFPSGPTRDSEENLNRLSIRRSLSTGATRRQSQESNRNNSHNKNNNNNNKNGNNVRVNTQENKENDHHKNNQNTPFFQKAKRKVNKAKTCLTGCFEENSHKMQLLEDNAHGERGQRLSSETNGARMESRGIDKMNSDMEHAMHEKSFDPYKGDTLRPETQSTVLQFIDGKEKELSFNPVWRESHNGTYHDTNTSTAFGTDGRRSSTTYTSSDNNTQQRRISDLSQFSKGVRDRQSKDSSRRGSDPPSQTQDSCTTTNEKEVHSFPVVKEGSTNIDKVPHPPGDVKENAEGPSLTNKNEQMAQRRFSTDLTNNVKNEASRRESSSSVATSHESTYWNDYYKEAAQVLHHEDSYFDRIAYKAHQSSSMPEPSPMATNSTATPVVALFRQDKPTKSLLGNMTSSPATVDGLHDDLLPNQESIENGLQTAKKDNTAKKASEEKMSAGEALKSTKNENHVSPEPADRAFGQREMNKNVVDLDITPKSSVVELSSKSSEQNVACDDDFICAQPSDEDITAVPTISKATESDRPMDEPPMYSNSSIDFEDFGFGAFFKNKNINQSTSTSCLDRRISADQVLMQTKLITSMKSDQPKRSFSDIGTKAATVQDTPKALVKQCDSIGSAYSYKDKDIFTPVTSVSTYPKGSPFRPRLNVPEMALAKAKLEQPAMFTQSFDIKVRGSRDLQIHTTESAPSMIQTHDYRDIAFGCFLEDTPTTIVNKKERALITLPSPGCMSLESPMSTTMSPAHPLLSEQVRNNAAFLFSPSYASANSLLALPPKANIKGDSQQPDGTVIQKEKGGTRESSISISTLASRSRLSTRSQHTITIPVSRGRSSLSPDKILSSRSVKSIVGGASQKSVRFSDSHSIAESDTGSQKSRRSVRWDFSFKAAPENVSIPAIETKVSDLSDTVFGGIGGRERESMESCSTKRESLESIKSQKTIIEEDATASLSASETASRPSLASTRIAQYDTKSSSEGQGTPEQNTRTWTYCEFSKGVTPMLDKKQLAQATNSPVLRFKAAKNKFVNKQEKEVPAKKSTPNLYKRKTGTGRVHLLASKFDTGGEAFLYAPHSRVHNPVSVTAATSTTANALSGSASNLPTTRPFLRTPQIMGYTTKAYPSIYERSSFDSDTSSVNVHTKFTKFNGILSFPPTQKAATKVTTTAGLVESKPSSEAPFDELPNEAPHDDSDDESQGTTESNESTYVQSVATIRQEDRESRSNRSNVFREDETDEDNGLDAVLDSILDSSSTKSHTSNIQITESQDMPCDEAEDDFAELLLQKLLDDGSERSSNDGGAPVPRQSTQQAPRISSIVSYDEDERSEYTNILAVPSYSDESTAVTLTALEVPKLRDGAKTVNPQIQKQHHPGGEIPSSSLFLSPVLKTQVQASKWRELRDQASRQDSKKNIFRSNKKKKGTGLRERDTNVA